MLEDKQFVQLEFGRKAASTGGNRLATRVATRRTDIVENARADLENA